MGLLSIAIDYVGRWEGKNNRRRFAVGHVL